MLSIHHFLTKDQIRNKNNLNLRSIKFYKPVKIGSFAVKKSGREKRKLLDNQEDYFLQYKIDQLENKLGTSLKVNYEQKFDNVEEVFKLNGDLDAFLKYIVINKEKFLNKSKPKTNNPNEQSLDQRLSGLTLGGKRKLNYDFVGLRALFSVLLRCQYIKYENFVIRAEKFEGTIYLHLDRELDDNYIEQVNEHAYAANKFEILATKMFKKDESNNEGDNNGDNTGDSKFIDQLEKLSKHDLCFVFSNKIGSYNNCFSLLYSASMCCFEKEFDLNKNPIDSDKLNSIELKINKEIKDNQIATKNFQEKKMLKYWSQSVLANVNKVACGFWIDDFKLKRIEEFSLDELKRVGWFNGDICIYHFNKILNFIKKSFDQNNDKNLLKFEYKTRSEKIICKESDTQIVPDFFKEELLNY